MPKKLHPKTEKKGDAGASQIGERRSQRTRPSRKRSHGKEAVPDSAVVKILSTFQTSDGEEGFTCVKVSSASTSLEPPKRKAKVKRRAKSKPAKQEDVQEWEDDEGVITVTAEPANFQPDEFKISRARSGKKRGATSEDTRSDMASPSAGRKSASGGEMFRQVKPEDLQTFLDYKAPRSTANEKFEDVYATIPPLRNASPPRFTTRGVKKHKMKHEQLGVRVVGKTMGNPYSNYNKRRNGVVYGNQPLKTVEEMERYAGAAINVKKALRKQAESLRLSSYVRPQLLAQVREQNAIPKKTGPKEEEDDVDIETVDYDAIELTPERDLPKRKGQRKRRGRRPGRTVLECEDCGYKTTHSSHMKIHIVCVHKDAKFLECQYEGCGYKCARKGSMTRHEKCVHRKDKVFRCEQCSFTTAWSISLERHIVTKHEKLRPWTCEICKKSFGQQFTLTTHMNTVHKKIKRIKCAFCPFRSTTRVSVRSHILRMHKEEIEKAMTDAEGDEQPDSDSGGGPMAEKENDQPNGEDGGKRSFSVAGLQQAEKNFAGAIPESAIDMEEPGNFPSIAEEVTII